MEFHRHGGGTRRIYGEGQGGKHRVSQIRTRHSAYLPELSRNGGHGYFHDVHFRDRYLDCRKKTVGREKMDLAVDVDPVAHAFYRGRGWLVRRRSGTSALGDLRFDED